MSLGEAHTQAGIIIPNTPMISVDAERIIRVMTKIARGIFYAYNRRPLPRATPVFVSNKIDDIAQGKLISGLMDKWERNTRWTWIGDEKAVIFKMAMPAPDSNHAIWLLLFFESILICAHSLPKPTKAEV